MICIWYKRDVNGLVGEWEAIIDRGQIPSRHDSKNTQLLSK